MNLFSGDSPPAPELFLPLKPVFAMARVEACPKEQKNAEMERQEFSRFRSIC